MDNKNNSDPSENLNAILKNTLDKLKASYDVGQRVIVQPVPSQEALDEEKAFEEPTKDQTVEMQGLAISALEFQENERDLEQSKMRQQIEGLKANNRNHNAMARGRKIDNRLRLQMASATFKFMQLWCGFVALIVFIYVAKNDGNPPPAVIIALLGTSTISIVGLVGFVVSGLFKNQKETSKEKE